MRHVDPASRLDDLIETVAPRFRRRFHEVVREIRDSATLAELARLLERRDVSGALRTAEAAVLRLANMWSESYTLAGDSTAAFVGRKLRVAVAFDRVHATALERMRANQLRMVREFTTEQRRATSLALQDAVERGLNPRQAALSFRDSIGLTARQEASVQNYRRLLQLGSKEALQRQLRDRRFDGPLRRGEVLEADQIDRMVSRYRDRYLNYRAEVIARTESLRSVHAGSEDLYSQAIQQGTLNPAELTRTWITSRDERVRGSHVPMHGQQRFIGEPFTSGAGVSLMRPGDPEAPAAETVQCRCSVTTRFSEAARITL